MVRKSFQKNKTRSLVYIVLCSVSVFGFLLIAVIPNQLAINAIQKEAGEIKGRIERQEVLYPFYLRMLKQFRRLDSEDRGLPFPEAKALPRNKLDQIRGDFYRAAARAGMEIELFPDLGSITGNSRTMTVDGTFRGSFLALRELMMALGELPYLQQLDTIEIQAVPDGAVHCKMKFRLALERA